MTLHYTVAAWNATVARVFVREGDGAEEAFVPSYQELVKKLLDRGDGEDIFGQLEDAYPQATMQIPVFSRAYGLLDPPNVHRHQRGVQQRAMGRRAGHWV